MGFKLASFAGSLCLAALLSATLPGAASAICAADCDGDTKVTVAELMKAVQVSLGGDLMICPSADRDGNLRVSVDELVRAVRVALTGCTAVLPFRAIQELVFSGGCALPTCHSAVGRQGNLVLEHEDVSWDNLVGRPADHPEAQGMLRVVPGDPANSFLVQKLRGTGVGDSMPQGVSPLSEATIHMIEDWIARGAPTSDEDCSTPVASGQASHATGHQDDSTDCGDIRLPTGDFVWEPEPPLVPPDPGDGVQLYVPPYPVNAGKEWELCYAFPFDPTTVPTAIIKRQEYRMHEGSHHLLLYMYFGEHPEQYPEGFWPCFAGNCDNPGDCPADSRQFLIPIGGTQVAGTRYVVNYPKGVGLPILGPKPVIIANLHYTNPFLPAQEIYGEAWINLYLYQPGQFKVLLDGIFGIGTPNVEPYQTAITRRDWVPRGLLSRDPVDAAVFQLFGHMHKRGREFTIKFVNRDTCQNNTCTQSGGECVRNADCGRDDESLIYRTTSWSNAPVQEYAPPYLRVNKDQVLRWQCVHENGRLNDPNYPPKKCHEGCNTCGWRDNDRKCHYRDGRVFEIGDPMPLVFGELADDDMCNMFGYFIRQSDLPLLEE